MKPRERQIAIGFITLVIGLLVIWAVVSLQPKTPAPRTEWLMPPYNPAAKKEGYGLGETPGYGTLTPAETTKMRNAASTYGVSEQEVEQIRVQTMHQGMYPEDAMGGKNARESQREQSRKASGFYDSQPRR